MTKKNYHYLNRFCPVCKGEINPYSYSLRAVNGKSVKFHSECVKDKVI